MCKLNPTLLFLRVKNFLSIYPMLPFMASSVTPKEFYKYPVESLKNDLLFQPNIKWLGRQAQCSSINHNLSNSIFLECCYTLFWSWSIFVHVSSIYSYSILLHNWWFCQWIQHVSTWFPAFFSSKTYISASKFVYWFPFRFSWPKNRLEGRF